MRKAKNEIPSHEKITQHPARLPPDSPPPPRLSPILRYPLHPGNPIFSQHRQRRFQRLHRLHQLPGRDHQRHVHPGLWQHHALLGGGPAAHHGAGLPDRHSNAETRQQA